MSSDPHREAPISHWGAPVREAAGAMIMLHGRGGSPREMLDLAEELDARRFACRVPAAADNSWYPFRFLEPLERNEPHLSSALRLVQKLLDDLAHEGIPRERVVLIGFSQGACLALEFAARHARRYGGVAALSGGLIGPDGTPRDYPGSLEGTPVFVGCDDADPHIPEPRVRETAAIYRRMEARVTERIYTGLGHAVNEDELQAVRAILDEINGR